MNHDSTGINSTELDKNLDVYQLRHQLWNLDIVAHCINQSSA